MNKRAIGAVLAATAATVLVPTTLFQVTTAGAAGQVPRDQVQDKLTRPRRGLGMGQQPLE